jgi:outer membrane protein OmpA-like peptidoglycan-associated protein
MKLRKSKKWKYETASSVAPTIAIIVAVGAGKGTITLKHSTGSRILFHYASGGIGFGLGVDAGIGGSLEEFPSDGDVYMTHSFHGEDLQVSDFVGGCLLAEASAALGGGASATALLFGIPPTRLMEAAVVQLSEFSIGIAGGQFAYDVLSPYIPTLAKGMIVMAGMTVGVAYGAGVLGSIGYLWHGHGAPVDMTVEMPPVSYVPDKVVRKAAQEDGPPIVIPGDVLFKFAKWDILRTAAAALERVAFMINVVPNRHFIIYGHTDSIGSERYNLWLSKKRAEAVKQWLVSRKYATASQLTAVGLGEEYPVMPNNSEAGRKKNRRVEVVMIKK